MPIQLPVQYAKAFDGVTDNFAFCLFPFFLVNEWVNKPFLKLFLFHFMVKNGFVIFFIKVVYGEICAGHKNLSFFPVSAGINFAWKNRCGFTILSEIFSSMIVEQSSFSSSVILVLALAMMC